MKRWRQLSALVLLALWLTGPFHCALERLGLALWGCPPAAESTGADGHSEHPCDDDCCPLENSTYLAGSAGKLKISAEISLTCLSQTWLQKDLNVFHRLARPAADGIDPPLARTWQFLWRTALPPRAPSFVS